MKKSFIRLGFALFFIATTLSAQPVPEGAILKYQANDLNAQTSEPAATAASPVPASPGSELPASELLEKLLSKAGKKEQKIIRQILETGEENRLFNRKKLDAQIQKLNLGGLVRLYQNLKNVRLKKLDLNRLDEIKTSLTQIDAALKEFRHSPKEFGDLSFFAGLTRDRLADLAGSGVERSQLRQSALANYNDSIVSLAKSPGKGSEEKIDDAKERIATLESDFGDMVPLAPKKGSAKVLITSDYGMRVHPVKKSKRFHSGIDLAGWKCKGWKVFSIGPGRVVKSGWETGYGYAVVVSHDVNGQQFYTRYAHLLKSDRLKTGTIVKQGDLVGYCNNSGISTGSHLHFEVREDSASGKTLDPKEFLPGIEILK